MKWSVLFRPFHLVCLCVLTFAATGAQAQLGDSRVNAALDKAIQRLFGKGAFTSMAEVTIKGEQNVSMDVEFAVLDGRTLSSVDLGALRSEQIPAAVLAQMKAAGLDKMVSITGEETAAVLIVYPNAKSYVEFTPPGAVAPNKSEAKVDITDIGSEKVNGQDCTKQKVVITDSKGATSEVLAWVNAKKQPVRLQTTLEGTSMTMTFKKVDDTKPDASRFAPPAGFTKYESPQALMMARMMEAMKSQP